MARPEISFEQSIEYARACRMIVVQGLRSEAVVHGDFTLSSGKKAQYYIDVSRISLERTASAAIGSVIALMAGYNRVDVIGGPLVGAAPLVLAAIAEGVPRGLLVRDGKKGHGVGEQIIGLPEPGTRVLMVDDVVSTGRTLLDAIVVCRAHDLIIDRAYALVDRGKDAVGLFSAAGINYTHLTTMKELGVEN